MSGAMSDHLMRDGFFGSSMISRMADVRVTHDQVVANTLLSSVDRPLIAEDRSGRRHAIKPGPITADGRGPAVCSDVQTVKIVLSALTDKPMRATTRKEPGAVQPQCLACRRRVSAWR